MKIMRLKRGDKVEVLSNHKASSGSWSCAEILSGNGHTYSIRYSSSPIEQGDAVTRVPRKAIRPCPPTVKEPNIWFPGDLAEVCHNFDWKPAKIMKLVGNDSYIVRLLGSPLDITVNQSDLRLRQAWQDGKWFMLRKTCYVPDSIIVDSEMSVKIEFGILKIKDRNPRMLSTMRKRKLPLESSNREELKVYAHERKVAENDVRLLPSLPKSAPAYSPQKLQKTSSSVSFPTRNISIPKVDIGGRDQEIITRTSSHIHIGSRVSSVCSTSYIGKVSQLPSISVSHPSKDEDYFSDAESSTRLGCQEEGHSFLTEEEARAKFHRSELRVYRSFINTLHASGPLRWEDEVELSNIRSSLHISNDEHLTVLRKIVFPKGKTSVI